MKQPELKASTPDIGVYLVLHPSTDLFYVGVSADLYRARSLTFSHLRAGIYRFGALQTVWNMRAETVVFEYRICKTLEEAYAIKQYMLDLGFLAFPKHILNGSKDAKNSGVRDYSDDERAKRSRVQKRRMADDIDYKAAFVKAMHSPAAIAKRKLIQQSPEFRKKMSMIRTQRGVMIEGVAYDSIQAAAFVYGVSRTTVQNRCNSTTEQFAAWVYTDKQI